MDGRVGAGVLSQVELFFFRRFVEVFQPLHFRPDRRPPSSFSFKCIEYHCIVGHAAVDAAVLQECQVIADLHGIFTAGVVNAAPDLRSLGFPLDAVSLGVDNGKEKGKEADNVDFLRIVNDLYAFPAFHFAAVYVFF